MTIYKSIVLEMEIKENLYLCIKTNELNVSLSALFPYQLE